jgi:hypothetical protein
MSSCTHGVCFLRQTRVQAAKVIKVIGRKRLHDEEIKKENTFLVKENRFNARQHTYMHKNNRIFVRIVVYVFRFPIKMLPICQGCPVSIDSGTPRFYTRTSPNSNGSP